MIVEVKESGLVRPASDTPRRILSTSNVDLVVARVHTLSIYFYRPSGASDFIFDAALLKDALARALVPFYPIAGRLKRRERGRVEIVCNAEGVLFLVAETDSVVDDLGDFTPTVEFKQLFPKVPSVDDDYSDVPLLLIQVTHFKCGGVSLGVGVHHVVADGSAAFHFINYWSDVTRGVLDPPEVPRPFIDRTILQPRDPPSPAFPHVEYHPSPSLKKIMSKSTEKEATAAATLRITPHQLDLLKSKAKDGESGTGKPYSTFVSLAAHVWRCACMARGLADDQETKLHTPADARGRLRPPLPPGYFGCGIFITAANAVAGELTSKPAAYAARKIREAVARVDDDEYLRSALDYLELQPDLSPHSPLVRGAHTFGCPNLGIVSWARLPIHDADFGWGRPIFMGPGNVLYEGYSILLSSPTNDGSLYLAISLKAHHMERFKKLFYDCL
ncbi:hypothetical protein H6P81_000407 [Aristolochia fimbriata]|uniref:Uncharacterized protein n=1 Tax=Aristolochia fimbriata TaxID=158543 RepID=A0AAV7F5B8_ARIFI|nr:hypothetical protein H6P81_000407 [Aristolochia fimbriata]